MTVKRVLILAILIIFAVFLLQNASMVQVRFLFWKAEAPRALILICFAAPLFCPAQVGNASSETAPPASGNPTEEKQLPKVSSQIQKVDAAGQQLGKKIDRLGDAAAGRLGGWVNVKAFAGISWLKLIVSFLLLLAVAIIERFVRALIERQRKKVPADILAYSVKDHVVESIGKPLSLFIWVYGLYAAVPPLLVHFRRPDGVNLAYEVAQRGTDLGAAVALIWFIYRLVAIVDTRLKKWAAATDSSIDDMLAPLLGKTLRVFIVIIGAILVIQNLTGVKIGPLLASLGVGGIAIALASKDSIANLFGTLTILFDKPFQVGQRIVIDGTDGTVESVGFRSTRIRTLTGHLVTIPNEKLVNTSIENIGKRPDIRWLNNITITYDNPPEKVEAERLHRRRSSSPDPSRGQLQSRGRPRGHGGDSHAFFRTSDHHHAVSPHHGRPGRARRPRSPKRAEFRGRFYGDDCRTNRGSDGGCDFRHRRPGRWARRLGPDCRKQGAALPALGTEAQDDQSAPVYRPAAGCSAASAP